MTTIASWLLTACGLSVMGIGAFFLVTRPPLMPEDARFMGSTSEEISSAVPGLGAWLRQVFRVLGGFAATTGLLVLYVANTGLRSGDAGAFVILAVAGVAAPGWMTVINFKPRSDFKWALLCLCFVWALGLLLALVSR